MEKKNHWWVYILIFIISQLSAAAVTITVRLVNGQAIDISEWAMTAMLFVANALAIALFFAFKPKSITWRSTAAALRTPVARRTALAFLLALPVICLVNIIQETFFPEIPDLVGEQTMLDIMHNPLGLITVAVLGPVAEELLFRGGVQTDLSRRYSQQGWFVPIAFSALVFSLVHMNPAQMPVAFILGCVLGFAYWWTGSLVAPILIHVFNNSFACLMAVLNPDDDSFTAFLGGKGPTIVTALASLFLLVAILHFIRKEGLKPVENF